MGDALGNATIGLGLNPEKFRQGIGSALGDLLKIVQTFKAFSSVVAHTSGELTDMAMTFNRATDSAVKTSQSVSVELENMEKQVREAKEEVEKLTNEAEKLGNEGKKGFKEFLDGAEQIGGKLRSAGIAITAVGAAITAPFVLGVKAANDFESAFIGVKKTIEESDLGTGKSFASLEKGLRAMSKEIPITFVELAKTTQIAGQLGVKGEESLLSFTRTIAELGVATDLTTEEAATAFARIGNVAGVTGEKLGGFVAKIGSVVVDLGNKFAANEVEITSMLNRIIGVSPVIGVAVEDLAALATGFSAVGVQAELGGTAFQQVMFGMNKAVLEGGDELKAFAEIAGLSVKEFKEAFEKDAAQAFITFLEGLKAQGREGALALEQLGFDGERVAQVMLKSAGGVEIMKDALIVARDEMKNTNALTKEAQARFDSFQSKLQVFKNKLSDLAATIGTTLLPALTDLMISASGFIEWLTKFAADHPGTLKFIAILGTAILGLGTIIGGLGIAISGVTSLLQLFTLQTIAAQMGVAGVGAAGTGAAVGVGAFAVSLGLALAAVVAIAAAVGVLLYALNKFAEARHEQLQSEEALRAKTEEYVASLVKRGEITQQQADKILALKNAEEQYQAALEATTDKTEEQIDAEQALLSKVTYSAEARAEAVEKGLINEQQARDLELAQHGKSVETKQGLTDQVVAQADAVVDAETAKAQRLKELREADLANEAEVTEAKKAGWEKFLQSTGDELLKMQQKRSEIRERMQGDTEIERSELKQLASDYKLMGDTIREIEQKRAEIQKQLTEQRVIDLAKEAGAVEDLSSLLTDTQKQMIANTQEQIEAGKVWVEEARAQTKEIEEAWKALSTEQQQRIMEMIGSQALQTEDLETNINMQEALVNRSVQMINGEAESWESVTERKITAMAREQEFVQQVTDTAITNVAARVEGAEKLTDAEINNIDQRVAKMIEEKATLADVTSAAESQIETLIRQHENAEKRLGASSDKVVEHNKKYVPTKVVWNDAKQRYENIVDEAAAAEKRLAEIMKKVHEDNKKLSPGHRESPSAVDLTKQSLAEMQAEYTKYITFHAGVAQQARLNNMRIGESAGEAASGTQRAINAMRGAWQSFASWVAGIAAKIRKSMEGVDPNVKHSPSIVDRVRTGMDDVVSIYQGAADSIEDIMATALERTRRDLENFAPSVNMASGVVADMPDIPKQKDTVMQITRKIVDQQEKKQTSMTAGLNLLDSFKQLNSLTKGGAGGGGSKAKSKKGKKLSYEEEQLQELEEKRRKLHAEKSFFDFIEDTAMTKIGDGKGGVKDNLAKIQADTAKQKFEAFLKEAMDAGFVDMKTGILNLAGIKNAGGSLGQKAMDFESFFLKNIKGESRESASEQAPFLANLEGALREWMTESMSVAGQDKTLQEEIARLREQIEASGGDASFLDDVPLGGGNFDFGGGGGFGGGGCVDLCSGGGSGFGGDSFTFNYEPQIQNVRSDAEIKALADEAIITNQRFVNRC